MLKMRIRKCPYFLLTDRKSKECRFFATQLKVQNKVIFISYVHCFLILFIICVFIKLIHKEPEWKDALPYSQISGPSKLQLLRAFMPGGMF